MSLTKTPTSMIGTTGATAGQVLTYNASTTSWVASAAPTIQGNPAAASAWVVFDATKTAAGVQEYYPNLTGTNRFIKSSYNVASVLRTNPGQFTITFTAPFADANYCMTGTASTSAANATMNPMTLFPFVTAGEPQLTSSTARVVTYTYNVTNITPNGAECNFVSVIFYR